MKLEIYPTLENEFKVIISYLIGGQPQTFVFLLPNSCLETLKKWAQDLRENKDLQGYNRIADFKQNKFCVLGILAKCNLDEKIFYYSYKIRESYLFTEHMSEIFQYTFDPLVARVFQTIFAKLNDNVKLSFAKIAAILDQIVDAVTKDCAIKFEFKEMGE